jgi:hypothetical protein
VIYPEVPVKEWTTFRLALEADVGAPDAVDSPGAQWLNTIREAAVEFYEYNKEDGDEDVDDGLHLVADGIIPVYTHEAWLVFTDLAVWAEDLLEHSLPPEEDMTRRAMMLLYNVAERLSRTIYTQLVEEENDAKQ